MSPRVKLWAAVQAYAVALKTSSLQPGDEALAAVDKASEEVDRVVDDMPATRRRLPTKRHSETYEFRIGGVVSEGRCTGGTHLFVRVGFYPDGRLGEVFLDTSKEGSDLRHFMNGFAMVVSLLLQVHVPVAIIVHVLERATGGPQGAVDGPDELKIKSAKSMIDLVAQVLAAVDGRRSVKAG